MDLLIKVAILYKISNFQVGQGQEEVLVGVSVIIIQFFNLWLLDSWVDLLVKKAVD